MYGVTGKHGCNDNMLSLVEIRNDILRICVEKPAAEIRFIGQGGELRGAVQDAKTAAIKLEEHDTYVRTEIENPESTLFLNPVVRYDGMTLPLLPAQINAAKTWGFRLALIFTMTFMAYSRRLIGKKLIAVRLRRSRKAQALPEPLSEEA